MRRGEDEETLAAGEAARHARGTEEATGRTVSVARGTEEATGQTVSVARGTEEATGQTVSVARGTEEATGRTVSVARGTEEATGRTVSVARGTEEATGQTVSVARGTEEATARTVAVGREALVGNAAQRVAAGHKAPARGLRAEARADDAPLAGEAVQDATGRTVAAGIEGVTIAAEATAPPPAVEGDSEAIERGAVIDRYVVLARLGAGGMGVVYAAYDPELDRKVALKLLRARMGEGTAASLGKARLVREAQALARLSHPHVVAIHDVGTLGDRVWLAMEYVDGKTFGTWLQEQRPRWLEILQVMRAVGEGLAAAHEAGLVHRDLKPDNIMIGRDGRVRVMDFGLARAAGEGEVGRTGVTDLRRPAMQDVTQAGAVMGTPAYMSPEQWRGEQADARADLFAFCVTLWEAVFGERPFAGETLVALAGAITGGELRAPPRGRAVPAWLRRALQRGLQVDPARRYPSMRALLEALARGQARGRRIRLGALVGLLAAGTVAAPLWQRQELARREAACVAAGEAIAEVWGAAARERLSAALGGAAAGTFEKMAPWIDRWVARWSEARVAGCRAAEVERTALPEQAALERACLAERREELVGLLDVIAEDPKAAVQRAVTAAASLSPIEVCSDPAALARRPGLPDDPVALVQLGALRRELLRIWGMSSAGRYADGLARARELRARAAAVGHAPLIAEAEQQVGALMGKLQQYDGAVQALERAFVAAGELGLDDVAAQAAIDLLFIVGHGQKRHEAATGWARAAELFVGRVGEREGLLGIRYLNAMASYTKSKSDPAAAVPLYERALAICERVLGPDHPETGVLLNNAGNAYEALGQSETAISMFERGLALAERALGEEHRLTMQLLSNYAVAKVNVGELDAAQALEERALRLRARVFGPDHLQVGMSQTNLGQILLIRGDLAGARAVYESALAIYERTFGPDSAQVAGSRENLALTLAEQGALEEAQALVERALALREKLFGPDDPEVAWSLDNLAGIVRARGALARARELELRALKIRERQPESRELALSLHGFGVIELTRGDAAAARAALVRALAIREKTLRADQPLIAETLAVLAEAERRTGALDAAEAHAARALKIVGATRGEDDPQRAGPLLVLGRVALDRGRAAEALPSLERALVLIGGRPSWVVEGAEARFALAQALAALPPGAGGDPARARVLASAALATLRTFAGGALPQRAAVEAWLRRRP